MCLCCFIILFCSTIKYHCLSIYYKIVYKKIVHRPFNILVSNQTRIQWCLFFSQPFWANQNEAVTAHFYIEYWFILCLPDHLSEHIRLNVRYFHHVLLRKGTTEHGVEHRRPAGQDEAVTTHLRSLLSRQKCDVTQVPVLEHAQIGVRIRLVVLPVFGHDVSCYNIHLMMLTW